MEYDAGEPLVICHTAPTLVVVALAMGCAGCPTAPGPNPPAGPEGAAGKSSAGAASETAKVSASSRNASRALQVPGLENVRRVTGRDYSGGEPKGAAAYRELARLGVRTVVSVDGARPDVEAARAAGLRYVHIPIGYDRISREAAASLARLARDIVGQAASLPSAEDPAAEAGSFGNGAAQGPVYIHCHHGRHRGPAAAAIVCLAAGDLDSAAATRFLKEAGTSPDYAGLWRDVAAFEPPDASAKLPELVEVAQVDSLSAAMAAIDRAFDNLKLCRDAGWVTPADHPDVTPAREALLLTEGFREAARNLSGDYDDRFLEWLRGAEAESRSLGTALKDAARDDASTTLASLAKSCARCHETYRD